VRNASAARIKGAEQQLEWAPAQGLSLSLGATELDPKLAKDFCLDVDPSGQPLPLTGPPLTSCPATDAAPSDTQLPIVPKFKGNLTARYTFPMGGQLEAHVQGAFDYQSSTRSELVPYDNLLVGTQPGYGLLDVLAGIAKGNFTAEVFANNVLECTIQLGGTPICGQKPLAVIGAPRTIGIRFGQRF